AGLPCVGPGPGAGDELHGFQPEERAAAGAVQSCAVSGSSPPPPTQPDASRPGHT
ncbi:hypothetical protein HaLaN_12713, partial [Haematococcus lacustris]